MANLLITGAAGFIGGALAKRCLAMGHRVLTIDNLSTGYKSAVPDGVECIEGDVQDESVYKSLKGFKPEVIYHIAGQSSGEISFDNPSYDLRTNAESTLHLMKYALSEECTRMVYASTMSIYGAVPDHAIHESVQPKPVSFYGVGKLASEHYLRLYQQYGLNSTALRLFNVYGPGQNLENLRQGMVSIYLAQMVKNQSILVKGSSERYRDFIYIDDVVDAFLKCAAQPVTYGQVYNIGTGKRTTVGELLDLMRSIYENEVEVVFEGNTSGDVQGIYADTKKAFSDFGFEAEWSLEKGLKEMLSWATKLGD